MLTCASCSEPIKEFKLDTDVQHITLKLYEDSTFIKEVEEIEDNYEYSGIWKGKLSEGDSFTTITYQKGLQIITLTPIHNYEIKNNSAILITKDQQQTILPIKEDSLFENLEVVIDTTWDEEELPETITKTNFDSLINTLPKTHLRIFNINEFPKPNSKKNISIDINLYQQIHGNKDGYDGPEYLISKIKSTDKNHHFLTYFSTAQGEKRDGTPYLVSTLKWYNTTNDGKLIQCYTLATEDINVITYKVTSLINSDTLIIKETYDQVLEETNSDSLCIKTYKYLIPTGSELFDTLSINRKCE